MIPTTFRLRMFRIQRRYSFRSENHLLGSAEYSPLTCFRFLQSYKSAMGFLTCWLIIPIGGQPPRFTTWGILSGLFWVPGGVAGIYGIRSAGLAVAVGTWSSLIVLTSFAWGVFVFEEHVKSVSGACCACGTLISGLIGMSIFSRPQQTNARDPEGGVAREERNRTKQVTDEEGIRKRIHTKDPKEEPSTESEGATSKRVAPKKVPLTKAKMEKVKANSEKFSAQSSLPLPPLEMEYLLDGQGGSPPHDSNKIWTMTLFEQQVTLTKRQVGLLACLFNGKSETVHFASCMSAHELSLISRSRSDGHRTVGWNEHDPFAFCCPRGVRRPKLRHIILLWVYVSHHRLMDD